MAVYYVSHCGPNLVRERQAPEPKLRMLVLNLINLKADDKDSFISRPVARVRFHHRTIEAYN